MAFDGLKRFGRNLLYGFGCELRQYEKLIVDRVAEALPAGDRATLRQQLAARERVQRFNSDRMVTFGFADRAALRPLADPAENHCLAQVRLRGAHGALSASFITHRGVISSIEFSKPPKQLNEFCEVASVRLRPAAGGYSGEIDAEEHRTPSIRQEELE